ncbi:MAG: peptidase MA family metallohydrolase [Candidatus Omnitrophota bacterium]
MKQSKWFFIIYLVATILPLSSVSHAEKWKELKGDHFIIYHAGAESSAKEILRNSEKYYKRIATELGYQRYSDFWTWDNRVGIYMYPNKKAFLRATGQPEWSEGMADYTNKKIFGYAGSERFVGSILPHEMAHLVFRDYVGFTGEVPLWLDEGVAQWMESIKRELFKAVAGNLIKSGEFIPFKNMMSMDIRSEREGKTVDAYYIEAVSLVGFLINKYGGGRFIEFCRQLRDGKSLNEALPFVYPTSIRDLDDLEKKWKEYILAE